MVSRPFFVLRLATTGSSFGKGCVSGVDFPPSPFLFHSLALPKKDQFICIMDATIFQNADMTCLVCDDMAQECYGGTSLINS